MRPETAIATRPSLFTTILTALQLAWCFVLVVLGTLHTCDVLVVKDFSAVWGFLTAATGTVCALTLVPCLMSIRRNVPEKAKIAAMFSAVGRTVLGVFLLKSTLTISTQGWEASNQHFMQNGRMTLLHHGNFTFLQAGVPPHVTYVATNATMDTITTYIRLSAALNAEINQIINAAFVGIVIIIVGHVALSQLLEKTSSE